MSMMVEAPAVCCCCARRFADNARRQVNYNPPPLWQSPNRSVCRRSSPACLEGEQRADSGPEQPADLLRFPQNGNGDGARSLGALSQYRIDVPGIGRQATHVAADPPQNLDRYGGQLILQLREVATCEAREGGLGWEPRKRPENADQIVGFGS